MKLHEVELRRAELAVYTVRLCIHSTHMSADVSSLVDAWYAPPPAQAHASGVLAFHPVQAEMFRAPSRGSVRMAGASAMEACGAGYIAFHLPTEDMRCVPGLVPGHQASVLTGR